MNNKTMMLILNENDSIVKINLNKRVLYYRKVLNNDKNTYCNFLKYFISNFEFLRITLYFFVLLFIIFYFFI